MSPPHLRVGVKPRTGKILIAQADLVAFLERCRVSDATTLTPAPSRIPATQGPFRQLDSARLKEAWGRAK